MPETTQKPVMVSGTQPTGPLHIGNYVGALKNWVEIQNSGKYDCFFFIADYHSLTEDYDPKEKQEQIIELVADYMASGLDPEKSTLFVQSQVPVCTELAWIFNTVTPVAELERMTQFKDKSSRQKKNINTGLFSYPVLQAADILIYKGAFVPVGEDQVQHVELTRDIARWFNNKFKTDLFPECKPILTPTARIMSPASPENKMSKSMGDKHWIGMDEEPEVVAKKVSKAVTTPEGIENLKQIYNAFEETMDGQFDDKNMAETKKIIAAGISAGLADYRKKKKELMKNRGQILDAIAKGEQRAQVIANETMDTVREIVGVTITQ